jgi:hypothetical protein
MTLILQQNLPSIPWLVPALARLPGVLPLEMGDWLVTDEAFAAQMALRDGLLAEHRAAVYAMTPGAEGAAAALLSLILDHLGPGYARDGQAVIRPDGVRVALDADPPLITAARLVQARVEHDGQDRACDLRIFSEVEAGRRAYRGGGAYLLRTNCEETDPVLLWKWYIQLTQAEAAFRTAKSDLGLRPVFHHKEDRVQAHILVCFLALALWRTLEQWMHSKGLGTCARQLVKEMGGINSVDVVVPVRRAEITTELRLRVVTTPEPATAQLLAHLGLRLPKGTREISNVVPKIAS